MVVHLSDDVIEMAFCDTLEVTPATIHAAFADSCRILRESQGLFIEFTLDDLLDNTNIQQHLIRTRFDLVNAMYHYIIPSENDIQSQTDPWTFAPSRQYTYNPQYARLLVDGAYCGPWKTCYDVLHDHMMYHTYFTKSNLRNKQRQ